MCNMNFTFDHWYAFPKEENHRNKGDLCTNSNSLLNLLPA